MMVTFRAANLKRTAWYEYVLRFVLGGLVTAGAGALAELAGPDFAGLFLAFPATLAASATLVARHERLRKEEHGQPGRKRSRNAAGADAFGAALGALGLISFAVTVWQLLPDHSTWLVMTLATLVWALVSVATWLLWKYRRAKRPLRSLLKRLSPSSGRH